VRLRVTPLLLVVLASIIGCRETPKPPPPSDPEVHLRASKNAGHPVEVTRANVGPIPLDSPLGFIAAHFPPHQAFTDHLEETPVPAWSFTLAGVTAVAHQMADSIDPRAPAEDWLIEGPGILLSGGVALPQTWKQFRTRYRGEVELSIDELGAHIEACELPGLVFFLEFDYENHDSDAMTADSIPGYARIVQIGIYRGQESTPCPGPTGLPN
jgi:hypothetical protein